MQNLPTADQLIKSLTPEKHQLLCELASEIAAMEIDVHNKILTLAWEINDLDIVAIGAYEIAEEMVMRPVWGSSDFLRKMNTQLHALKPAAGAANAERIST